MLKLQMIERISGGSSLKLVNVVDGARRELEGIDIMSEKTRSDQM